MTITTEGVITPELPAERIEYGRMVLARAKAAIWPEEGGKDIAAAMEDLWLALDIAEAIEADLVHPASQYPELTGDDKKEAMQRIAGEVQEWAEELVRLFPAAAVVAERSAA